MDKLKKCPFCAEYIKIDAIKCKHCHSMLEEKKLSYDMEMPDKGIHYLWGFFKNFKSGDYEGFFKASPLLKFLILSFLFTLLILPVLYFYSIMGGLILTFLVMGELLIIYSAVKEWFRKRKYLLPLFILLLLLPGMLFIFTAGKIFFLPVAIAPEPVKETPLPVKEPVETIVPPETAGFPTPDALLKEEDKTITINHNIEITYNEKLGLDYLERCKLHMENVGSALEMYATDHAGDYPPSLQVLKDENYLFDLPVCPLCRKPYIYTVADRPDFYTITCGGYNTHYDTGEVDEGNYPVCVAGVRVYFHEGEIELKSLPRKHHYLEPAN